MHLVYASDIYSLVLRKRKLFEAWNGPQDNYGDPRVYNDLLSRSQSQNNKLEDAENLLQESLRCAKTSANARLEWEALHCLGDLMRRVGMSLSITVRYAYSYTAVRLSTHQRHGG